MECVQSVKKFEYFSKKNLSRSCDNLTGLLCRETIVGYVNHLLKKNIPFCLAMVDVDNFKMVNDTFGHKTGDKVLAATAKYICEKIGEDGVVGWQTQSHCFCTIRTRRLKKFRFNPFQKSVGNLNNFNNCEAYF